MSGRLGRWALSLLMFSAISCQKNSDKRSPPAPALNPDAPAATADSTGKPGTAPGTGNAPTPNAPAVAPRYYAYVGGNSGQLGIYRFELPAGTLQSVKSIPMNGAVTSFMAFHPTSPWVYVVNESGTGGVMAFAINPDTGDLTKINEVLAGGPGPTHVSVGRTGRHVMTANYATGQIQTFTIQNDGSLGAASEKIMAGTKAHQILSGPSGNAVYVPCLGSEYVGQYTLNPISGVLTPMTPSSINLLTGGPRHMAFHPTNPWAYVLKELNSTIQAVSVDPATQQLKILGDALPTRPVAGGNNSGAEVQVHPSGSFVYTSNRGDNTIAMFTVNADGTLVYRSVTPTGGAVPRHFSILPNGRWLLAANQDSGTVTVLELNPETGALAARGQPTQFPAAQFVEVIDLNRYKPAGLR